MGSEGLSLGAQPRRGAELRSHLEEVRLGQGSGKSRVAEQPCEGKQTTGWARTQSEWGESGFRQVGEEGREREEGLKQ